MFDIQHDGFVARLSVVGDLIRGEVRDTRELLIVEGQSIPEVRKDFVSKVEDYCSRCKRRGIPPFANPDGKSSVETEAKFSEDCSALEFDSTRSEFWPRNHGLFFGTKSDLMLDQMLLVQKSGSCKISTKLRLPIDNFIDVLRERKRSPSLLKEWQTSEGAKNLLTWLRIYLMRAFRRVSNADPIYRVNDRDSAFQFLADARRLEGEGTNFLDRYGAFDGFPRFSRGLDGNRSHEHWVTAIETQNYLTGFLERLSLMMSWAHADLDIVAPEFGGRPRIIWKHEFVATIAELWEYLTHKKPSSKPDGLFTDLVDAAWRSGGDDMPTVEWGEAIRTFCHGWNKRQKVGETPQASE